LSIRHWPAYLRIVPDGPAARTIEGVEIHPPLSYSPVPANVRRLANSPVGLFGLQELQWQLLRQWPPLLR
jgi:hypothetical protein